MCFFWVKTDKGIFICYKFEHSKLILTVGPLDYVAGASACNAFLPSIHQMSIFVTQISKKPSLAILSRMAMAHAFSVED